MKLPEASSGASSGSVSMTKMLLSANTDWYLFNFRLSLANYSRQQGFEVVFVSPPGKFVKEIDQNGFRWIEWNLGRQTLNPLIEIKSLINLAKIYRQERPDLVHHHTIKPVLYGSLAARWMRVPGIVNSITGRGYIFLGKDRKARLLKHTVKPIYRLAFNTPKCIVIFENETDQHYFASNHLIPAKRTWLIPGVGVDPERFFPLPEPKGVPVIMMASRMLWDKGVGVLVEAARILHAKIPARVVLVGEPDTGNPATIEDGTLAKWHTEGVIEWWGWRADMPSIYNQSHIVTLPTMYGEGVPTTLLEAAACGRPLVASDNPGCRHVVREGYNGFLVPPNNPQALADALERLACDPDLRGKMGNASRQLVMRKFTQSQINDATLKVYQSVLNTTNKKNSSPWDSPPP